MKRFKYLSMTAALLLLFVGLVYAGNKSPMFSRHQPGGMFGVINETQTTGNIWFVDSGSATGADAAGYGENPDAPFLTIDYAIGNCTASNGDWIIVMPGHADTVSSVTETGYINVDVAGIRIIGLGDGINRPIISWSSATGYITVSAANVSFENLIFDMTPGAGKAATGVSLYKTATDTKFDKCTFLLNYGSGQVTHAIYAESGGTRTQIENCKFLGSLESASGVSDVIRIDGNMVNDVYIVDSTIIAYGSSPLINASNMSSKASGWMINNVQAIQGNTGVTTTVSGNKVTGLIVDYTSATVLSGSGATKTTAAQIAASPL